MASFLNNEHLSVLSSEILAALDSSFEKTVIDATFGGGGYTQAFLKHGVKKVIAFDRDPTTTARAEALKHQFK